MHQRRVGDDGNQNAGGDSDEQRELQRKPRESINPVRSAAAGAFVSPSSMATATNEGCVGEASGRLCFLLFSRHHRVGDTGGSEEGGRHSNFWF